MSPWLRNKGDLSQVSTFFLTQKRRFSEETNKMDNLFFSIEILHDLHRERVKRKIARAIARLGVVLTLC